MHQSIPAVPIPPEQPRSICLTLSRPRGSPLTSKNRLALDRVKSIGALSRMLLIPGTGKGERGTGNGERGTGNGERGTGNGSLGTSVQRQPS